MIVAAGTNSGIYKFLLVLHILCAIIGFGSVYLNALYGQQIRKRRGAEGIAIYEANFFVTGIGQYFIYAVFVLGILLVVSSDDAWKFSQTWVWLAMTLYVIALGVSHGILLPAVRRMSENAFFSNRSLWMLISGGVFDRFPDLRVSYVETQAYLMPKAETLTRPGATELVGEALWRGAQCTSDFSQAEHLEFAPWALEEVRVHFGVPPRKP